MKNIFLSILEYTNVTIYLQLFNEQNFIRIIFECFIEHINRRKYLFQ